MNGDRFHTSRMLLALASRGIFSGGSRRLENLPVGARGDSGAGGRDTHGHVALPFCFGSMRVRVRMMAPLRLRATPPCGRDGSGVTNS
jgi:hypothetical protein